MTEMGIDALSLDRSIGAHIQEGLDRADPLERARARDHARRLFLGCTTEDDRWSVFTAALVEATRLPSTDAPPRSWAAPGTPWDAAAFDSLLTLNALRDILCPLINREEWRKLGWDDAVGGQRKPEDFIRALRVSKAAELPAGPSLFEQTMRRLFPLNQPESERTSTSSQGHAGPAATATLQPGQ